MKTKLILGLFGLLFLSSCTTVVEKDRAPRTTSTTTEQSTTRGPYSTTTESQTTRSF